MKSCASVGVGFQVLVGAWLLATSLAACGSEPQPEPKTPDAAPAPSASAVPAAAAADSAGADAKPEAEPKPEADAKPVAPPPPKDPNAMREVKYVVTPEGLKIEVAGVRFMAAAQAKQIAQGWGAKITVKAEVLDSKEHVLLNPKNGPIAFAAAVFKKGSTEAERIPDERSGEGELKLSPAAPTSFSRDFPNKGGRVLGMGETLDMEVALWGLGDTSEDRRPVKQFFHVKMKVEKGKPKASVEPPAAAGK
ncbi:MAG TPA: hypothetical protein VNG33_11075 [Polyangiaceae bacterium]|nr:hypothetical protein [Polyangiaceae bacterium]